MLPKAFQGTHCGPKLPPASSTFFLRGLFLLWGVAYKPYRWWRAVGKVQDSLLQLTIHALWWFEYGVLRFHFPMQWHKQWGSVGSVGYEGRTLMDGVMHLSRGCLDYSRHLALFLLFCMYLSFHLLPWTEAARFLDFPASRTIISLCRCLSLRSSVGAVATRLKHTPWYLPRWAKGLCSTKTYTCILILAFLRPQAFSSYPGIGEWINVGISS